MAFLVVIVELNKKERPCFKILVSTLKLRTKKLTNHRIRTIRNDSVKKTINARNCKLILFYNSLLQLLEKMEIVGQQ